MQRHILTHFHDILSSVLSSPTFDNDNMNISATISAPGSILALFG
jgi:hypothetical protein